MKIAKLCRFYGWDLESVRNLNAVDAESLWQAITVIEAQDMLMAIKVNSYPNLKRDSDRKNLIKELTKLAYPRDMSESVPVMSTKDFAMALSGGR